MKHVTVGIVVVAALIGTALVGERLFVSNTDAIVAFTHTPGSTQVNGSGRISAKLSGGPNGHHWTKDIIASPDGKKLYATVGSNINPGENGMDNEISRAAVLEINNATGTTRIFASGVRNPNGLSWQPSSSALWVAVNERDEKGGIGQHGS
jgi:glucose/arabinose dehydrogenase